MVNQDFLAKCTQHLVQKEAEPHVKVLLDICFLNATKYFPVNDLSVEEKNPLQF